MNTHIDAITSGVEPRRVQKPSILKKIDVHFVLTNPLTETKQKAPEVNDDNAKWLVTNEGFINFIGLGPLGVVVASGGDGVR